MIRSWGPGISSYTNWNHYQIQPPIDSVAFSMAHLGKNKRENKTEIVTRLLRQMLVLSSTNG